MVIDIHVHPAFFEPINEDEALEEIRHEELNLHKNGTAPLKHFFNKMNCAGIDHACLLPEDYSTSMDGKVLVSNEEIRKLVDLAPDRFIGFASVDPHDDQAAEKLEHAFRDLDLKGLKLHPSRQSFHPSDKIMDPLYDLCERYDRPILFHAGLSFEAHATTKNCRPLDFEDLIEERPGLRICLAHFGWPWCRETAMLMLKHPNVYTDTGALYFDSAKEFYVQMLTKDVPMTWIDRSLRHQVLFGTNDPRFEMIRMSKAIEELGFRESTVELIKGKNAVEFLHYDPEVNKI
jgi:predicted TIM-barrel fold metal-dependent hydrolase